MSQVAEHWDIFGNQTDAWGFTRYSIAVHVPEALAAKVMRFRGAIGLADLTSEPHVSITTALYQPTNLDELKQNLAQSASSQPGQVSLAFGTPAVEHHGDDGWIAVSPTQSLLDLRQSVLQAVAGLVQSRDDPKRSYRPHVTLYQSVDASEAVLARDMADDFGFGTGFDVESIELVGRVGPARGGSRQIIDSYALGPKQTG